MSAHTRAQTFLRQKVTTMFGFFGAISGFIGFLFSTGSSSGSSGSSGGPITGGQTTPDTVD